MFECFKKYNYFCPTKQHNIMNSTKKIASALISVFDKTGLEPIVKALHQNNVTIYSTGGTETFIKDLGIPVPDYIEENVSSKVVKIIQSYTGVVNKMVWRKEV